MFINKRGVIMQERFNFGPEFADHMPVISANTSEKISSELRQENPHQLRFFILDKFAEVK